jgi:branched-chain amino acid transport system substrate-binding protein
VSKLKLGMLICVALLLVLLPVVGCAKPAPEAKPLKIGVLGSVTGWMSIAEANVVEGTQLAKDDLNAKGGVTVNGQNYLIELVLGDMKSAPDGAIAAATKLVQQDQTKFIVGAIVPFMNIAAGSVTEPAKALRAVWFMQGTPDEMNAQTKYTFRTGVATRELVLPMYQYLVQAYPNVKTVAITTIEDGSHPFVFAWHEEAAKAVGLEVVAEEAWPVDTQDFYPLATKLLAAKPDVIANGGGFSAVLGNIMKAARELGFKGPGFVTGPPNIGEIRDAMGKDLATDWFGPHLIPDSPEMTPEIKHIVDLAVAQGQPLFKILDYCNAYNSLWCTLQAIEKAQSLDPTEVAQTWEGMKSIETTFGKGKMGGLETYGVNHVVVAPVPIGRIMNGEIQFVKWIMPEVP